MDARELERLHTHYTGMDDDELVAALYYGPDAYVSSEVWKIIAEEASRRGMAVPTEAQLLEHEAAAIAVEPPPVPWGWNLYIRLTRVALIVLALHSVVELTEMLDAANRREGWERELGHRLSLLGMVGIAAWARHRQLTAVAKRLASGPETPAGDAHFR